MSADRISEADCQRAMELAAAAVGKPWERGGKVYVGSPHAVSLEPVGELWSRRSNGKSVPFDGAWHLNGAYGGLCVHEVGASPPIVSYHAPKRELFTALQHFRHGAEAASKNGS